MSDDRLGRVHLDSKGLSSFKPAIADAGLQGIAGLFFLKIAPYSTNPRLAASVTIGAIPMKRATGSCLSDTLAILGADSRHPRNYPTEASSKESTQAG